MRTVWIVVALVAFPAAGRAQALVPTGEDAPPFHLSTRASPPIEEGGALWFFGHDLATNTSRAMRVDATGARAEAGIDDAAAIAACGGARWVLGFEALGMRGSRWELREAAGPPIWSRTFPATVLPDVRLGCAAGRVVIGWLDAGSLSLSDAAPSAMALRERARLRVMSAGSVAEVPWAIAPRGDVVVAALPAHDGRPGELVRIALGPAGGAITHRQPLFGEAGPVVVTGDAVLVALALPARQGARLAAFDPGDLTPRASATIAPSDPTHDARCTGLWPGPGGDIAVAIDETWLDGFVAIPQGGNLPDRAEPAHHSSGALRLWEPARDRLGPALPLATRWTGAGGWLGATLVVVQEVESAGVSNGVVQLRPSRVRRFIARP